MFERGVLASLKLHQYTPFYGIFIIFGQLIRLRHYWAEILTKLKFYHTIILLLQIFAEYSNSCLEVFKICHNCPKIHIEVLKFFEFQLLKLAKSAWEEVTDNCF